MVPQVEGSSLRPEGASIAFLLVHGFAASIDQVASLAEFLNGQGIASFSVSLAGHDGVPESLEKVKDVDWYESVKAGYDEVKSWNPKKLFVAGLSLGGALSLKLASEEDEIDGLVAMSPAVYRKGIIHRFLPILKLVKPYRNIDLSYIPEMYDIHYSRVDREPLSVLRELFKVMKQVQSLLHEVKLPTVVIQSGADKTIDPGNGPYVFERISSKDKELHIIDDAEHVITCHAKRFEAFEIIMRFVQRIST